MEIKITSDSIGSEGLEKSLKSADPSITLELRSNETKLRGVDPTVLVAIVGTVGTTLVALINNIFSLAKERQLAKIVIESKDGSKIELPSNYPLDKLDVILKEIKQMNYPQIFILK